MITKLINALLAAVFLTAPAAAADSPYRGQETRDIKALSQAEIEGYQSGAGMGLAKAAELNHYPGPRHVLELASELGLTEEQKRKTRVLFDQMQTRAIEVGEQLVSKERELDGLFADGAASEEALRELLDETGMLLARLRYVHLSTHIAQKRLLTEKQIMLYDRLRGYGAGGYNEHAHGHGH